MLASAHNVRAVLSGRSLSDCLAATPVELRAASQAISFHVMRRLGLMCEVRNLLVQRTPPNAVFDALLLVSLALLDTAVEAAESPGQEPLRRDLPVYAVHTVVDQAVQAAAGQRKMVPYKGLLNATLRGFLRERSAILAQALQNPEAQWNYPEWWIRLVKRAYPRQWERLLEAANQPGPMSLRVNVRRSSPAQVLEALATAGIDASPLGDAGVALAAPRPVQQIPGFEQGWWSVQDASAQQAAVLLQPESGWRVLDACAAPGGKTAHLLELADIELQALDTDASRLDRVGHNLERLGLMGSNVSLRCADAADPDAWWDGRPFDAVLADVPCTASGIVRRHPDIRWLRREADVARTAGLQRKIVDALWKTVKPGGRLLYATCSIFPQEGEQQALQFLKRHADALRLPAPGQLLPITETGDASLYDGFFYALFAKLP
ncbi:16S rRNA (cytosine(967)-C(5))-methyltransferase RsmB [Paralcaligenes sp. KSB-10]|uniref:16S rRNA (cytosine(967)-C(5))-methyltransferase RsmB n=1 Tax=Paralcaligenes sp. KSB-10 TaxID=2901142 RepID=UPI001E606C49|nr:16S rRNA (cytosine(967)-C(5))-methyltransferase RsmB [Paralcaligenes sp. KSB-10]UHL66340.1 16S rRNA (cytosine(967)-C(5))-methyltransferase RsmB [Paralcaligenes sp. KSB-10]